MTQIQDIEITVTTEIRDRDDWAEPVEVKQENLNYMIEGL